MKSTHWILFMYSFFEKFYKFTNILQCVCLSVYQVRETTENAKMKKCRNIISAIKEEFKI